MEIGLIIFILVSSSSYFVFSSINHIKPEEVEEARKEIEKENYEYEHESEHIL